MKIHNQSTSYTDPIQKFIKCHWTVFTFKSNPPPWFKNMMSRTYWSLLKNVGSKSKELSEKQIAEYRFMYSYHLIQYEIVTQATEAIFQPSSYFLFFCYVYYYD